MTVEMDPLDAGTDNGFTFTAPNWPTEPQGVIYRITSTYPAHPASSFYYPESKRLPPIATYQFIKVIPQSLSLIRFALWRGPKSFPSRILSRVRTPELPIEWNRYGLLPVPLSPYSLSLLLKYIHFRQLLCVSFCTSVSAVRVPRSPLLSH